MDVPGPGLEPYTHVQAQAQLLSDEASPQDSGQESDATSTVDTCPFEVIAGLFYCRFRRCKNPHKGHKQPGELRKHQRNHTRPLHCDFCVERFAQNKYLHRHMWAAHSDEAGRAKIPREISKCPVAGCLYKTRSDNLPRHVEKVHKMEPVKKKRKGKGK